MARGTDAVAAVKKQSGLGQSVSLTGTEFSLPLVSESMQATPTVYGSQALRKRALQHRNLARLGTLDVSGGIELEATNQMLHDLLPLIFPNVEDDPDTVTFDGVDTFSRTYTVGTDDELDYFTLFIWDGDVRKIYKDCRINSATIQADINQLARFSLDIAGVDVAVDTTPITSNVPPLEYGLYFEQAIVKLGAAGSVLAEVPAQSFSMTVNRNLDTNRFRLGSRYRRNLPGGMFDLTGSVTLDANPLTDKTALYKSVLNSEWMALELSFVDPTNEVGGQPSKFTISLPYVLIEWPQHNITGPEFIQGAINFTAYDDDSSAPTILHQYALG